MGGMAWLSIAIVAEVIATSALKASDGFRNTLPSIVTAVGYSIAFWCMSQAIRTVPVGLAYAIWSGVGIVLITAIAWVIFRQRIDPAGLIGIALIIAGVLVIQLFSKSTA
ncbi:MAG: multidrug efflux SMR transporter [Phenylobacterium sp.]|uniref:DMT family transporter n=1 Tax=Phenylobacterium sp. TaxID=1871053 RepID=UPI0017F778B4|nr:multidrug efflux SMR transporter [Phenylobacterium sp.]MBA4792358.1 multidrug efflux SMR transporter [Phenylobacterium sp.]